MVERRHRRQALNTCTHVRTSNEARLWKHTSSLRVQKAARVSSATARKARQLRATRTKSPAPRKPGPDAQQFVVRVCLRRRRIVLSDGTANSYLTHGREHRVQRCPAHPLTRMQSLPVACASMIFSLTCTRTHFSTCLCRPVIGRLLSPDAWAILIRTICLSRNVQGRGRELNRVQRHGPLLFVIASVQPLDLRVRNVAASQTRGLETAGHLNCELVADSKAFSGLPEMTLGGVAEFADVYSPAEMTSMIACMCTCNMCDPAAGAHRRVPRLVTRLTPTHRRQSPPTPWYP